jgi:hypothetical protein
LRRTFHIIFGSGSPVQRRLFIALTAVTICSVAVAIWTDCQPRYIQGEPGATARSYANLREKLILASGRDGLFIRFIGFETGDATMNRIYNYAVYAMYPKRVLVGDPSLLANGPEEITAVNKPRDDSWLVEHHIGSVLTVKRTSGEPELGSVHWIANTQHPENDPTAAIAESAHVLPCAAFLLCCLIVGYAIISTLAGDQPLPEQIGYAAVVGPGVLGLILIYLSMGGVLPSRTGILCCTLPFLILAAWNWHVTSRDRQSKTTDLPHPPPTPFESLCGRFCLIAIAYAMVTVITTTLLYPAMAWDAFSIWQLKAKVLATLPLRPRPDYFTTVCLSHTHLRYPILAPMMSAGVHAMAGGFDRLASAPDILLFGGLSAVVFCAIRRKSGMLPALVATALLMNLETMYHWAGAGTGEMPLTAFYGCSVLCLLRWVENRRLGDLVLASVFTACMAWTKNEGVALAAINLLIIVIVSLKPFGTTIVQPLLAYLIVAMLCAPWAIYIRGLPRTDEDYAGRLTLHNMVANTWRLPSILHGFSAELLRFDRWGIFWLLLIGLVAIAFISRRGGTAPVRLLLALLVLHLVAYIPAFMVTNWKITSLMGAASDRLFMHATPAAAVLIGWLWLRSFRLESRALFAKRQTAPALSTA